MSQRLAAFDLEIAKGLPDDCDDWKEHRPLGISCAALAFDTVPMGIGVHNWHQPIQMDRNMCQHVVRELLEWAEGNYTIVGFNSLSFDFSVLAEESDMYKECEQLALNHIDLMFIVVTLRGHFLGLDKAAKGMGIKGKLKEVKLNDGTVLKDMAGAKAPELWAKGEYQAVLDYLGDDVRSTLELAQAIQHEKRVRWVSAKGYEQIIKIPKLYTVKECLELRRHIPGWVTDPVSRKSMMEWIK
jgi:hypothetical protein